MFTGIIEHTGTIESLGLDEAGGRITVRAPDLAPALAVSGSIAVNGCCLTIVALTPESFSADLSRETLEKTSFRRLAPGARVNLERPLVAGKEFGGHFVLGHVDATGRVARLDPQGPNWWFGVEVGPDFARHVVMKGSVTIDGISLTVARWDGRIAEVAVIPYTYQHTNLSSLAPGDAVNLEGDVVGKYVERYMESRGKTGTGLPLTVDRLVSEGF